MPPVLRLLISERRQRTRLTLIWAAAFLAVVFLAALSMRAQVEDEVETLSREALAPYASLAERFRQTRAILEAEVTAEPCTAAFASQLRRVAYLPDGFNEFLYAPGGIVRCSAGTPLFDPPMPLGVPDFVAGSGTTVWIDRSLSFLGLHGLEGTIALVEPFAIVLPKQDADISLPAWMRAELVALAPDGRRWTRSGEHGIYDRWRHAHLRTLPVLLADGTVYRHGCTPVGIHCLAAEISLPRLAAAYSLPIVLALLLAAAVAQYVAGIADSFVRRRWSFESRIRRELGEDTIRCVYQPILDLRTGRIEACEVLARWRDFDGSLVSPDRFIPIVEAEGLTRRFTEIVVDRAFAELSANIPAGRRIEVHFNIFPRDLDAAWLLGAFAAFHASPAFDLALEIVETDAVSPDTARREIEALRKAGIRTYIDDFGRAYSNIQALADLPVEGVKLDRSFAQAPDDSLLARLLSHAIDMIRSTGRTIVVEGVESPARLSLLQSAGVDRIQGFAVSRPLDARALAAFVETWRPAASSRHAA